MKNFKVPGEAYITSEILTLGGETLINYLNRDSKLDSRRLAKCKSTNINIMKYINNLLY